MNQQLAPLLQQVATLPQLPGVYRFFDANNVLLYVGKAINLKKRVTSYFYKEHGASRIGLMVTKIAKLEITVVRTEAEALLLENNLIKTQNPKFNIVFRDDKSYPYLKVTKHKYPRVSYYRGAIDKKHFYAGPYPNASAVKETIAILQRVFLLRNCEDSVFANRSRPCLLYQIRRCSAPCMQDAVEKHNPQVVTQQHWQQLAKQLNYQQSVKLALDFLQGNTQDLLQQLQDSMQQYAQNLQFEQAAVIRNQISALSSVLQQQSVEINSANAQNLDVDVIAVVVKGGKACVNLAMVRGGRHLGDRAFFPSQVEEALTIQKAWLEQDAKVEQDWVEQQVLQAFVLQHYSQQYIPHQIIANVPIITQVQQALQQQAKRKIQLIFQPQEQRKVWLTMALQNANIQLQHLLDQEGSQQARTAALVTALDLPIEITPQQLASLRIECFDVSHTSGEAMQASCVVYQQNKMQPSQYRRYNIDDISNGDDYAAMRQVLTKRYARFSQQLQQDTPADIGARQQMPDLVLIDGGKGQIAVAKAVFEQFGLDISILVGVEKGEKRKVGLEELVFADGRAKVYLGKDSAALMLVAQIRDEAHRFAITGMRAKRASVRTKSSLEQINGVGAKRRAELLKRFGGAKGVAMASVEELASVPGISKVIAQHIYSALH